MKVQKTLILLASLYCSVLAAPAARFVRRQETTDVPTTTDPAIIGLPNLPPFNYNPTIPGMTVSGTVVVWASTAAGEKPAITNAPSTNSGAINTDLPNPDELVNPGLGANPVATTDSPSLTSVDSQPSAPSTTTTSLAKGSLQPSSSPQSPALTSVPPANLIASPSVNPDLPNIGDLYNPAIGAQSPIDVVPTSDVTAPPVGDINASPTLDIPPPAASSEVPPPPPVSEPPAETPTPTPSIELPGNGALVGITKKKCRLRTPLPSDNLGEQETPTPQFEQPGYNSPETPSDILGDQEAPTPTYVIPDIEGSNEVPTPMPNEIPPPEPSPIMDMSTPMPDVLGDQETPVPEEVETITITKECDQPTPAPNEVDNPTVEIGGDGLDLDFGGNVKFENPDVIGNEEVPNKNKYKKNHKKKSIKKKNKKQSYNH
ncbi:hypothetical protein HK098_007349 [Nowakowskiella sp. JEL0407]|nr:hypothetical protein HK098_007349 [Nowakowskiella sp. JEL0407]